MLVPAAVQVAIQFIGLTNTIYPIMPLGRLYWLCVPTAAVLSLLAPLVSVAALSELLRQPDEGREESRVILEAVGALLVGTSWLGCGFTFLAHPIWIQGYSGK